MYGQLWKVDWKEPVFLFFSDDTTGRKVKVIVTDFVKEDVFGEIEDQLRELNIGVLGWINTKFHIQRSSVSPLLLCPLFFNYYFFYFSE